MSKPLTFKKFLLKEWDDYDSSPPNYEDAMELLVDLGNDLIEGERSYIGTLPNIKPFEPNDRRLKPLVQKFIYLYKVRLTGEDFGSEEDFVDARYELIYTFLRKYEDLL